MHCFIPNASNPLYQHQPSEGLESIAFGGPSQPSQMSGATARLRGSVAAAASQAEPSPEAEKVSKKTTLSSFAYILIVHMSVDFGDCFVKPNVFRPRITDRILKFLLRIACDTFNLVRIITKRSNLRFELFLYEIRIP